MRVFYDSQTFLRQRSGGISRLFSDLIAFYAAHTEMGVEPILQLPLTPNEHLPESIPGWRKRRPPSWVPRHAMYLPEWIRGSYGWPQVALTHHTYYSRRFLRHAAGSPSATTIYDMIPELFAGTKLFTGSHLAKRRYVESCDLVICISESTRSDMLAIYGEPRGKVCVVPLASDRRFSPGLDPLPGLPEPYILYVGGRTGYKDFCLLPEALGILKRRGVDVHLVIVGGELSKQESTLLRRHGQQTVIVVRLSDTDLPRAYANARALVQTSRYEGFGLPPLEAMQSGVPVVVANASSMPEVCGPAGFYFEPGSSESLALALERALTDESSRGSRVRIGLERAAGFSLERMAASTVNAYRSVLD